MKFCFSDITRYRVIYTWENYERNHNSINNYTVTVEIIIQS
jgi:hypothetical protein